MTKITIQTERLPPKFQWDPLNPIRGTEQFYVQTARHMAKAGHDVVVEMDGLPSEIVVDGAIYAPRHSQRDPECLLVCNPRGERLPPAKRTVHWTNFADFTPYKVHARADKVILVSEFARRAAGFPLGSPEVVVVGHGYDPAVFYPPPDDAPRKRQVVYSSSPDRGGTWLAERWAPIEDATGYKLVQTAYPGFGKPLTHPQVANLLRESEFWVHPGLGTELFCLAAAEAQACGCVPIYAPEGALPETIHHGHSFPLPSFLNGLETTLNAPWLRSAQRSGASHLMTWQTATQAILRVLAG